MKTSKRLALAGVAAAFLTAAGGAFAQAYPTKPVRLIVPFVAGAGTDITGRTVAQKLTERWGQQAVVDNRPGAGGIIGVEIGARAAPDGYTLIVGHVGTHASAQMLHKNLGYDPIKDFEPISNLVNVAVVFVVHPAVAANTLKDFVAFSQGSGGRVNYGSPGAGTSGHLTGELFNLVTKARMTHIPYKGAAPALTDVVAGQAHLYFTSPISAQPFVKGGRLRMVAVTRTGTVEEALAFNEVSLLRQMRQADPLQRHMGQRIVGHALPMPAGQVRVPAL